MSEAEVVLGVDHFNWIQQIWSTPSDWKIWTFRDMPLSDLAAMTEQALSDTDHGKALFETEPGKFHPATVDRFNWYGNYEPTEKIVINPAPLPPELTVSPGDLVYSVTLGFTVDYYIIDNNVTIIAYKQHTPFFDPIVQKATEGYRGASTRGFAAVRGSTFRGMQAWFAALGIKSYVGDPDNPDPSDESIFLYNEPSQPPPGGPGTNNIEVGFFTTSGWLSFGDAPVQALGVPAEHVAQSQRSILFETRLVGVDSKGGLVRDWTGTGYKTNLTWRSDAALKSGGGVKSVHPTDLYTGESPDPSLLTGGVFDVQLTDLPQPAESAAAAVQGVVINDGSARRSMVTSLTVTFSSPVHHRPRRIELRSRAGGPVGLTVTTSLVNGQTVAVLTFSGPEIVGGSLADGSYTLTVHGDKIYDGLGRVLDGDSDGIPGGDYVDAAIFRLFGDTDGDGDVDNLDLYRFKVAYSDPAAHPEYLGVFDFNGDGKLDQTIDFTQLKNRYGKRI